MASALPLELTTWYKKSRPPVFTSCATHSSSVPENVPEFAVNARGPVSAIGLVKKNPIAKSSVGVNVQPEAHTLCPGTKVVALPAGTKIASAIRLNAAVYQRNPLDIFIVVPRLQMNNVLILRDEAVSGKGYWYWNQVLICLFGIPCKKQIKSYLRSIAVWLYRQTHI
jgi:hypothetical protein